MSTPLFKPISCTVEWLISNIDHGSLGLPDIQRPFVWNNPQVRDLFDSMFRGYPVGFLLFWAAGGGQGSKQIGAASHGTDVPSLLIIDGQQRLTSLYAVMKGKPVLDKNFVERHITIAFKPENGEFAVYTAAVARSPEWIPNISDLFTTTGSSRKHINVFLERLEAAQGEAAAEKEERISGNIERLLNIRGYTFSALEIDEDTDEELVSDIFVRVNSGGQKLNQSDFILTLMSVFWAEGRDELESFCKRSRIPSDLQTTPYIRDDGVAVGINVGEKTIRDISQAIAAHIEPKIYPEIKTVPCDGIDCIRVYFSGSEAPYFAYGRAYMRVGDEDRQISARELENIFHRKNQDALRWDNKPCAASPDDLDEGKVKAFVARAGLTWDTLPNALQKLDLLHDGKLVNAALVFFAKKPVVKMRCAVFASTTSATLLDHPDYEGDILELIDQGQAYILKNIFKGMRLEGLYRVDVPELAVPALREALINAFCHRDYHDPDEVRIAIF